MATRSSVSPVWRLSTLQGMLQNETGDDPTPLLNAPSVRLFTGALQPNPTMLTADFTAAIANFTGYANQSPDDTNEIVQPSQASVAAYGSALFVATAPIPPAVFVPNTITGYYVVVGTEWVMAERFADGEEVEIGAPFAFLDLAVFFGLLLNPIL